MCRGKDMNVMVMDVEGTDGRERGEDQVRRAENPQ
jgi:protein SEY1